MKKVLYTCILAAVTFSACQNNEIDCPVTESRITLTAVIDDGFSDGTKTSLDEYGNVLWKKGDQISAFLASTINQQYQVTDASDGKTSASLNAVSSTIVAGTEISNNVAFYPYASTASIAKNGDAYVISDITLPATQTYAANSFGNGAFPMAAVTSSTTDNNLKFKNVLGGLKLQLKGTATIASISVTGNNNEILCGAATVTASNGSTPSINLTDASAKTVTLNCDSVALDETTPTSFIIALPPMTMTGGFTVIVTDTESKQMEIKTTKSQTIARSGILKMPAVVYNGIDKYTSEPFTITSTGTTEVKIYPTGSPSVISLEYRIGSADWNDYSISTSISLSDGESLQFRAGESGNDKFNGAILPVYANYYHIVVNGTGTVIASGNIMSLLDRTLQRSAVTEDDFYRLFIAETQLVDASNLKLPATTLAESCYMSMFLDCSSLTNAPELPATSLASRCYSGMFQGCKALIEAPELPATTLIEGCYNDMFLGCSNLNYVKALFTTMPSSSYTRYWLSEVSSTGTFVKSKDASWNVSGSSGIPSGWTVLTE